MTRQIVVIWMRIRQMLTVITLRLLIQMEIRKLTMTSIVIQMTMVLITMTILLLICLVVQVVRIVTVMLVPTTVIPLVSW